MFANRLKKNIERLAKRARREQLSCYRLYDADMPEYSFAIDRYAEAESGALHLYVQEYEAPSSIDPAAVRRRRAEVLAALPQAADVPLERIHLRTRRRQRGASQYERHGAAGSTCIVEERGRRFEVNFSDYLDTGLFLDHRITRARLAAAAARATLPQSVLLHRNGHGVRRRGRSARIAQPRHVQHLPRLGAAQFRAERSGPGAPPAASAPIAWIGSRPRRVRPARPPPCSSISSSSIRRRSRIPSACRACSTSSAITPR